MGAKKKREEFIKGVVHCIVLRDCTGCPWGDRYDCFRYRFHEEKNIVAAAAHEMIIMMQDIEDLKAMLARSEEKRLRGDKK